MSPMKPPVPRTAPCIPVPSLLSYPNIFLLLFSPGRRLVRRESSAWYSRRAQETSPQSRDWHSCCEATIGQPPPAHSQLHPTDTDATRATLARYTHHWISVTRRLLVVRIYSHRHVVCACRRAHPTLQLAVRPPRRRTRARASQQHVAGERTHEQGDEGTREQGDQRRRRQTCSEKQLHSPLSRCVLLHSLLPACCLCP